MTIRVVLADDQSLLRGTFRLLLDAVADIEVVAEAANGAEAVAHALAHRPDVVLMDIRMPEMDGVEATRLIAAEPTLSAVHVLVLTTFEDEDLVVEALRAGAGGYLGKGVEPARLIEAVRTVASGEALLSPAATAAVVARVLNAPTAHSDASLHALHTLTQREREIVTLVATGMSNDQIADHLTISPSTAKTHVNRAMTKVGARDRAQLVVYAYQTGLMMPGRARSSQAPPHL